MAGGHGQRHARAQCGGPTGCWGHDPHRSDRGIGHVLYRVPPQDHMSFTRGGCSDTTREAGALGSLTATDGVSDPAIRAWGLEDALGVGSLTP
jgi:hypothetical protein